MSDAAERATITTGRMLDDAGEPLPGPALTLREGDRATELLRSSPHPLMAGHAAGTWACLLERPAAEGDGRPVLLQWLTPAASAPPPHTHPTAESFEVLKGELTVELDGAVTRLGPGESRTVDAGVAHTFRNESDERVALRAELPSLQTVSGQATVWGRDAERWRQEGRRPDADGQPGPLAALVLSEDMAPDTTMTAIPTPVQRLAWTLVAPIARRLGHQGVEERYLTAAFWEHHVEQPLEMAGD